ncbi:pyridoxamine 5'-phosphate oxidase family protein [Methylomarinum sp. Ch1-1]|uniref:Pyridoxamine 5'-phosphate oxidase family protein n=1 Tax=Methylomarinum roseum TaxID=3067653 RepID=A0AAU7NZ43_9GAMM|nr:pyridoxamine 5'-phosphate oxidase family protein [Methylomarinum sp. Ch1-1]MDP4521627.1 pyridoxamine 5'-phosphate oxidase family protein [Methylomarinum sp. Ch1-1]
MPHIPRQDPPSSAYVGLLEESQTLLLSSYSQQQGAEISYAPYVRDGLKFYVFVSELARHTTNMLTTLQASVMFIRPETDSDNLFARERVVFNCRVQEISPEQALYQRQLQALQDKFGETVALLRSLNDFHLLQLEALRGQYIAGFGKAYAVEVETGKLMLMKNGR